MRGKLGIVLVIFCACAAIGPALAHHSFAAEFDGSKTFVVSGTLTKVDWMNPHVYVYLDVKDADGKLTTWALSTLPTAMMRRAGLSKESIVGKPGETVTIDMIPARDGTQHLGWISKITYADGHFYQLAGQ